MKKVDKINKIIQKMEGKLIGIGINDEMVIKEIDKNNNIYECDLLDSIDLSNQESGKKKRKKYIKKLRKKYKDKSVDYIIMDPTKIFRKLKFLIKDTIYINNKKIYIYMDKNDDYEFVIKRYKRYTKNIETIKCDDGIIINIDSTDSKKHIIKNIFYYIIDTLYNISDMIGDILVS